MLKVHPRASAILLVALLLAGGLGWRLGKPPSLRARTAAAIHGGQLAVPDGTCAIDLYRQLARQEPEAAGTIRLRNQLVNLLLPQAELVLEPLEANAPVDADFPQQAKIFGFLATAMPDHGRWLAGKFYCEARVASARSRFRAACAAYRAALEHHHDWPLALDELGSLYAHSDSPYHDKYAEKNFQLATWADQQFVPARVHLADLYLAEDKLVLAVDALRSALAIEAARPDLLFKLGKIQRDLHHLDEAIDALSRASQYEEDPSKKLEILRLRDLCIEEAHEHTPTHPSSQAGRSPR